MVAKKPKTKIKVTRTPPTPKPKSKAKRTASDADRVARAAMAARARRPPATDAETVTVTLGEQRVSLPHAEAVRAHELLRHVEPCGGDVSLVLAGVRHDMTPGAAAEARRQLESAIWRFS